VDRQARGAPRVESGLERALVAEVEVGFESLAHRLNGRGSGRFLSTEGPDACTLRGTDDDALLDEELHWRIEDILRTFAGVRRSPVFALLTRRQRSWSSCGRPT
jgi:hypothetical protein